MGLGNSATHTLFRSFASLVLSGTQCAFRNPPDILVNAATAHLHDAWPFPSHAAPLFSISVRVSLWRPTKQSGKYKCSHVRTYYI